MVVRASRLLHGPDSTAYKILFGGNKYQFTEWRMKRKSRYILLVFSAILAGAVSWNSYYKLHATNATQRLGYIVGWTGEYAQDFSAAGQPPLNLNLPPHMRCDMKSYLDLPETVIPPPPTWDELHPYLKDRYTDLFLEPAWYTREHAPDTGAGWLFITPWGSVPGLENRDTILSSKGLQQRAEDGVLFSQDRKTRPEPPSSA